MQSFNMCQTTILKFLEQYKAMFTYASPVSPLKAKHAMPLPAPLLWVEDCQVLPVTTQETVSVRETSTNLTTCMQ